MNHGLETKSPARHCHLCKEMTERGIVAICRHFADHLEDIAIAASPMDIDSDDDSNAGSTKSRGHLAEEEEKLQTISEADEDSSETAAEVHEQSPGRGAHQVPFPTYQRPIVEDCDSDDSDNETETPKRRGMAEPEYWKQHGMTDQEPTQLVDSDEEMSSVVAEWDFPMNRSRPPPVLPPGNRDSMIFKWLEAAKP
jgi:hypothetical protein